MKTVISVQEITELEIKPEAEVSQWRALVESEIALRWADRSGWIGVGCPCCTAFPAHSAFSHAGVEYDECPGCGSVFAPRRPGASELRDWYRNAPPARFWRDRMLLASGDARREKVVGPRAQWVVDGIAECVPHATRLLDLSTNGRMMVEQIERNATGLTSLVAAGMVADLEGGDAGRVVVRASGLDGAGEGTADVVTAVDALDRAADMRGMVEAIHRVLAPGGVLFATVAVSSGFDIQALWERSPSVLPPDRLNLPSVNGLQRLFAAPAWELIELSTTGMFDVEIVHRTMNATPEAAWPRVARALVLRSDAAARQALIEYLQAQRLTSFARFVARRIG